MASPDRGDDTLEMFALMDKLREQALHAGGRVLSHLGNHEVRVRPHSRQFVATDGICRL